MEWLKKHSLVAFIAAAIIFFFLDSRAQLGKWFGPGELSRSHEEIEGISNCTQCHSTGIPHDKCLKCHTEIKSRVITGRGYHAKYKDSKCGSCHIEHKGKKHDLGGLDEKKFKHEDTGWPLTGKHTNAKCKDCHKEKKKNKSTSYMLANPSCVTCHKDVHEGKMGVQCENCHGTESWKPKPTPTPAK